MIVPATFLSFLSKRSNSRDKCSSRQGAKCAKQNKSLGVLKIFNFVSLRLGVRFFCECWPKFFFHALLSDIKSDDSQDRQRREVCQVKSKAKIIKAFKLCIFASLREAKDGFLFKSSFVFQCFSALQGKIFRKSVKGLFYGCIIIIL